MDWRQIYPDTGIGHRLDDHQENGGNGYIFHPLLKPLSCLESWQEVEQYVPDYASARDLLSKRELQWPQWEALRDVFAFAKLDRPQVRLGAIALALDVVAASPTALGYEVPMYSTEERALNPRLPESVYIISPADSRPAIEAFLNSEEGKGKIFRRCNSATATQCGWVELNLKFLCFTDKDAFERAMDTFVSPKELKKDEKKICKYPITNIAPRVNVRFPSHIGYNRV